MQFSASSPVGILPPPELYRHTPTRLLENHMVWAWTGVVQVI
jgi:hypothetical protein